jgi:hypothetical protein
MLVRELDIVKLGDCPATMGMEPNLVRAPVVMPKAALPEFTATDIRPIVSPDASPEKKQEEYERMHRELADLKLQMQMARLEKSSDEDLRKELAAAKEEIARLKNEREKLKESFNHFDGDKKSFKAQLENEVAELKLKSLRELKEQREADTRKFEKWKSETAANLASAARTLADQKAKTWNQRPFSKELAHEWDTEISAIFRRVILSESKKREENAPPPVQTASNVKVPIGLPPKETTQTNAHKSSPAPHAERRKRPRQSNDGPWQRIAVGGFILALFMAVAWYASIYLKRDGARTMASQMVETAPPPPPANRAAANPDAGKTKSFKKTYTDNVLGTLNYVDAELNMDFRALWLKDLSRAAAKDWKLDAKTVNDIANKEIVLIQDLNRMKNNAAQMRQRESQFMKELQSRLGKRANTDKFMRLKRAFYTRNQVYLTRETR